MFDREVIRRASAEAIGTALLVAAVVGSGIAAQRLSPGAPGLELLENALATGAALVALILALGPISGAHFNPVVTLAARVLGGTSTREAGCYIGAQVVGACVGSMLANLMFELPVVSLSTHQRSGSGMWLGEFIATFGLLVVVLSVVRSGRTETSAFAVGGYITAAYWFTSSTSFANPAVTIGRTLTNTFSGIRPSSAAAFIAVQVAGGLSAVALMRFWRPNLTAVDLIVTQSDTISTEPRRSRYMPESDASRPIAEQQLARVEGHATDDGLPTVLFLCVHNAGRSQMALGWFQHLAGDRAVAWSGGSEPGHEVNPAAVAAMAEIGIDISEELPKPWTEAIVQAADVVITMGCGDACPLYPGKRYEDWELEDPAGQDVAAVRSIRDEIGRRVEALLHGLGLEPATRKVSR